MSGWESEVRMVQEQIAREKKRRRIRKNQWDNWYGYLGTRRVIAFFNTPTETAEAAANRWLKEEPRGQPAR